MKTKQGFTLIELVVTIAILAILFLIAVPIFSQFQSASRLKESVQTVETIFGESFSSARSRGECVRLSVAEDQNTIKVKTYPYLNKECQEEEISNKDSTLSSRVKISQNFELMFKPPFGNASLVGNYLEESVSLTEKEINFSVYNDESVNFVFYLKSGLLTKVPNSPSNE